MFLVGAVKIRNRTASTAAASLKRRWTNNWAIPEPIPIARVSGCASAESTRRIRKAENVCNDAPGVGEKGPAALAWLDPSFGSLEELKSDLFFELRNLIADGRLRYVQAHFCSGKAPFFSHAMAYLSWRSFTFVPPKSSAEACGKSKAIAALPHTELRRPISGRLSRRLRPRTEATLLLTVRALAQAALHSSRFVQEIANALLERGNLRSSISTWLF